MLTRDTLRTLTDSNDFHRRLITFLLNSTETNNQRFDFRSFNIFSLKVRINTKFNNTDCIIYFEITIREFMLEFY